VVGDYVYAALELGWGGWVFPREEFQGPVDGEGGGQGGVGWVIDVGVAAAEEIRVGEEASALIARSATAALSFGDSIGSVTVWK